MKYSAAEEKSPRASVAHPFLAVPAAQGNKSMALLFLFFSLFPAFPGVSTGKIQLQNNEECQGGIHCKKREQSLPACPAGFFCPGGNSSVVPVPCPPGTFRAEGAALPSHRCLPCPVDFSNPRPGQKFCFPCGSEAVQPAEGQRTCVCLGKGQVFQPRDGLCACPPGFRRAGRDGKLCARLSYPVCHPPASRNQDGQCLSSAGWARYCSHKVCAVPEDFRGYDKALGLCICHSASLEEICNSQCRMQQNLPLHLSCAGGKAQLVITHTNGSKTAVLLEGSRKVLPNPNFSLEDACAAGQQTHPVHVVEMGEKGFLGVYNPDPQRIHDLLMLDEAPSLHKTPETTCSTRTLSLTGEISGA
ncbi:platelet endothelial aggregation receptor 1-like isoform X2 [Prinia subflava]|uniref:platelet endothelial aggregation receptor 1-like isoform X2 n=1 Tax=Prinia subflava TaxID=208062 RepID=UPI002FE002BA